MHISRPSIKKIRENNKLILSKNQKLMNANRTLLQRYTELIDKMQQNQVPSISLPTTSRTELYI